MCITSKFLRILTYLVIIIIRGGSGLKSRVLVVGDSDSSALAIVGQGGVNRLIDDSDGDSSDWGVVYWEPEPPSSHIQILSGAKRDRYLEKEFESKITQV